MALLPPGANTIHQVWDKEPNLEQDTQFTEDEKRKINTNTKTNTDKNPNITTYTNTTMAWHCCHQVWDKEPNLEHDIQFTKKKKKKYKYR